MHCLKKITANNHLPSSNRFIGGLNEKVSICFFGLHLSVSWGFVFVCSTNASVGFLKVRILYSFKSSDILSQYVFQELIVFFLKVLFCFLGGEAVFGLWSWEFSNVKLFLEWMLFTLLSIVFSRNFIYFKENVNVSCII